MSATEFRFSAYVRNELKEYAKNHKVVAFICPAAFGKMTAIRQTFPHVEEFPDIDQYIKHTNKIPLGEAKNISKKLQLTLVGSFIFGSLGRRSCSQRNPSSIFP